MSATSSLINLDYSLTSQEYRKLESQSHVSGQEDGIDYYQQVTDRSYWYELPYYPTLPVEIDEAWAEYLNPFVPTLNTTVIDSLMKAGTGSAGAGNSSDFVASVILSGLIANGMARQGFSGSLQGTMATVPGPNNTVELDGTS